MNILLAILFGVLFFVIFFQGYEYIVYRLTKRTMSRFAAANSLTSDAAEYKTFGWTSHHVVRGTYLGREVVVSQSKGTFYEPHYF